MKTSAHKVFLVVSTIVVLAAVVAGFAIVGSPEARRRERMDDRRLKDLRSIHWEIQDLVLEKRGDRALKRPLPATLDEVVSLARRRRLTLEDPETGERYGYRVLGDRRYELCATFARERDASHDVFWNHPPGRHCFTIDALDPP